MSAHPLQRIEIDARGTARFRKNAVVEFLLDEGPFDMNHLALKAHELGWSRDDQAQFAQLIGYSVGGFCDLSYVSDAVRGKAVKRAGRVSEDGRMREEGAEGGSGMTLAPDILEARLRVATDALRVANEILNTRDVRLVAMDQNPLGIRDVVGHALNVATGVTKP